MNTKLVPKLVIRSITTSLWVVVMLFSIVTCKKEQIEKVEAIENRADMPKLKANDITTYISDSGVTRYRISAPRWDVYDRSIQPYWEFPEGIHFEKFNENLKVDANIHSEYARFNEYEQRWELKGNVKATNLQGELFETSILFWDQRTERIYSDSLITITQKSHIIVGKGFESNQQMTRYTIRNPEGVFPIEENK